MSAIERRTTNFVSGASDVIRHELQIDANEVDAEDDDDQVFYNDDEAFDDDDGNVEQNDHLEEDEDKIPRELLMKYTDDPGDTEINNQIV